MSTLWQSDTTIVDRVRIRPPTGYSLSAQQRIEHLLRNAVLRPSRLPLSAILFLRKLQDPAPETRWNYERVHPPHEWEESASRELDRLAAQAVRPALARVPPSAQAVLFLDRAELLACLAADWLQGTLRANWWWFTLLKRGDLDLTVFREWTQSPEFLPAALEILAARRCVTEFLRPLPHDVVSSLLDNMLAAFAVPRVVQPNADAESPPLPDEEPPPKLVAEPWLPFVPEASTPDLAPSKRLLLAHALMLRRAPARARAISFQQQLAHWQACADYAREPRAEEGCALAADPVLSSDSRDIAHSTAGQLISGAPEPAHLISPGETDFALPAPRTELPTIEIADLNRPGPHILELAAQGRLSEVSSLAAPACVESAFGGIFFLLNVALHLKLYSDFTSPRTANLELDIWDFLYLLGLRFVPPEMRDDDVFPLLATLACRTIGQEPGEHFRPPENWRLPQEWLDAFPELFERQELIRDGRLQVIHPAGFLLVDEQRAAAGQPVKPLDRWLNWVATYIEARLMRALGRDAAAQFLCSIPARVSFTSSHLDVVYWLDVHPVEIRRAGLDRNPGWIPAAGRFVAFYFE